jgi:diadenosine tetraphosphate (Ap4A) HIT family hydrolase
VLVPGCLSCDILAGRRAVPGGVIYESEYWHVDSVVSPVLWRGFLIIKLKRHCEHLAELTREEAAALGPVIQTTCLALSNVLKPAKVYVCSFGDGVRHIHFWVVPRPLEMRPGMHWVFLNLDVRVVLSRRFGIKKWMCSDEEAADIAAQVRQQFRQLLRQDVEGKGEQ